MFPLIHLLLDLLVDVPKQTYRGLKAVLSGDCVIDGVTLPPRKIFGAGAGEGADVATDSSADKIL